MKIETYKNRKISLQIKTCPYFVTGYKWLYIIFTYLNEYCVPYHKNHHIKNHVKDYNQ